MSITPTDELGAVNSMLASIGEASVMSLNSGDLEDVTLARTALSEVSLAVQTDGWHWNTESRFPLTPDENGTIHLPANLLHLAVDPFRYPAVDPVPRGKRLYDRASHSFRFREKIEATIVLALAFDEMPEVARRYITMRASRLFQDRATGSVTLAQLAEGEINRAWVALRQDENRSRSPSILAHPTSRHPFFSPRSVLR